MGCPARRVVRGCAGAALAADLDAARAVISAVRQAVSIPVTVKLRLGLSASTHNYIELGLLCQELGVAAVTLHPRTAQQQYSGQAEWSHIARLRQALNIPVFGNGDVRTPEDAARMRAETNCDAVMIGRASLSNPWIFRQSEAVLAGQPAPEPSLRERHRLIVWHFEEVITREDEKTALHKLRKFTGWYTHGLPEGRGLRRKLSELGTSADVLAAVHDYFAERSAA
jgi:tRNA-dihydrouridine synthase B